MTWLNRKMAPVTTRCLSPVGLTVWAHEWLQTLNHVWWKWWTRRGVAKLPTSNFAPASERWRGYTVRRRPPRRGITRPPRTRWSDVVGARVAFKVLHRRGGRGKAVGASCRRVQTALELRVRERTVPPSRTVRSQFTIDMRGLSFNYRSLVVAAVGAFKAHGCHGLSRAVRSVELKTQSTSTKHKPNACGTFNPKLL